MPKPKRFEFKLRPVSLAGKKRFFSELWRGELSHKRKIDYWRFAHKGNEYLLEEYYSTKKQANQLNVYSLERRGRKMIPEIVGLFDYSTKHYRNIEGKRMLFAFGIKQTRRFDAEVRGIGLGSLMLRIAENKIHGDYKKKYPKKALYLAGSTQLFSVLSLFLRNNYKLTEKSWNVLMKSEAGSKLELKERNEKELLKQLKLNPKLGSVGDKRFLFFYKEMKKPNKI